jgi:hypothetical protein
MKRIKLIRLLVMFSLALILLVLPVLGAGCAGGEVTGITATKLAATMVPAVNLDVYIYVDQQVPTKVPKALTGAPVDLSVQSLAIWGVVTNETQYTVAGALTFTSVAEAGAVFAQLPKMADLYTKLADRTIYVLYGTGPSAESLKNAIANNNFKKYDDKAALAEVAKLPSGGTTLPGLIGIIKPSKAAVNMVRQYLDQGTANTIDSVYSNAKPSVMTLGLFGTQPIDMSAMMQKVASNTVWEMDLGVVISMDSAYPGFIFSPIASKVLSDQGLKEVKVGELSAFKTTINAGAGKAVPIYLNISGNHVYAVASGKDAYAQTLLTAIIR